MKRFPQKDLRLDEKELKRNLGQGNFIFVGSSTDMWSPNVPGGWIADVLYHIYQSSDNNKYLFQSKNPQRFIKAYDWLKPNFVLGTTIESNRDHGISHAPKISDRAYPMQELSARGFEIMVTIEPILEFDMYEMVNIIRRIKPTWVNIGADSKNHNLPEPSWRDTITLINALKKYTEVKVKSNLERLMN
jgi:DNA repair photolyase